MLKTSSLYFRSLYSFILAEMEKLTACYFVVTIIVVMATIMTKEIRMKILIINGSPRINGATGQILTRIKENMIAIDPDLEIIYTELSEKNMQFCSGCLSCYKTGQCYIKEDGIEELSQMIEKSDGVIFGSPTYVSNVSGQMKILIDRGHFVFEQLLKNKACFSVITYENFGGKQAHKIINNLIRFSGGAVSCKYLIKLNHGDSAINDTRNAKVAKLSRKFLLAAKRKNPLSLYEKILRLVAFHVGIKPHVFKNKSRYKGIVNRWIEKGYISEEI